MTEMERFYSIEMTQERTRIYLRQPGSVSILKRGAK
jgi:hypothetical protein